MGKVFSFLKEARAELGKVVWPTRRRALRLTTVVVVVTALFAGFIGLSDLGLSRGVEYILSAGQDTNSSEQPVQVPAGGDGQPVQIPAGGAGLPNQPNQQPSQ